MQDKYSTMAVLSDDGSGLTFSGGKQLEVLKPLLGKRLIVDFCEDTQDRTSLQNRYYWFLVKWLCDYTKDTYGERPTKAEMHLYLSRNVLGHQVSLRSVNGEDVFVVDKPSTSKLSKEEFGTHIERIRRFFAEKGLELPQLSDYEEAFDNFNI